MQLPSSTSLRHQGHTVAGLAGRFCDGCGQRFARWPLRAASRVVLTRLESFGAPHTPFHSFQSSSVGGTDETDYLSWSDSLDERGVPQDIRDLSDWHTWSVLYKADDVYQIYYDGYLVQQGSIRWRLGGAETAEPVTLRFLFDLGWGHNWVSSVNIALWSALFPLIYELDYSRVYLR